MSQDLVITKVQYIHNNLCDTCQLCINSCDPEIRERHDNNVISCSGYIPKEKK